LTVNSGPDRPAGPPEGPEASAPPPGFYQLKPRDPRISINQYRIGPGAGKGFGRHSAGEVSTDGTAWTVDSDASAAVGQPEESGLELETEENLTFATPKRVQQTEALFATDAGKALQKADTPFLNKIGRGAAALIDLGTERVIDSLVPIVARTPIENVGWNPEFPEEVTVYEPTPRAPKVTSRLGQYNDQRIIFNSPFSTASSTH
jgi:hypothetical protein